MNKKIKTLFIFLLIIMPLYASVTEGTTGLLHIRTNHFDIIYRDASRVTANLIYTHCEEIYSQVTKDLDSDPNLFLPVVITDKRYILNAYFSQFPYNRIVLYDTLGEVDSLSNFETVILGIFKHELTHAVEFNTKSKFWQAIGKVIPSFSPQNVYSAPFITEGLAVTEESLEGYGRLNDISYLQLLVQSKLDNKFPSAMQASGARDIYPAGLQYQYGGAFFYWLRKEYSQESINAFIKANGRLIPATSYGNFSRAFKISLTDAWNKFRDELYTPDVLQEEQYIDKKSRYKVLFSSDEHIYCYDSASSEISEIKDSSLRHIKYHSTYYPSFSVMPDGRLIVPVISEKERKVVVYDGIKVVNTFKYQRAGFYAKSDNKNVIVTYTEDNGTSYLTIWDDNYNNIGVYTLGYGVTASCFCTLEDGRCAMLIAVNGKTSILVFDPLTMTAFTVPNTDNLLLRSLTAYKNTLCFSYAGILSCYGKAVIDGNNAKVSKSELLINGGIYYPVLSGYNVIYIANFYDNSKICIIDEQDLLLKDYTFLEMDEFVSPNYIPQQLQEESKYRPLSYFGKFSILPFAFTRGSMFSSDAGFGLTYMTQDPTETWTFNTSLGYNPLSSTGFGNILIKNDRTVIPFAVSIHTRFPSFELDTTVYSSWTKPLNTTDETIRVSGNAGIIFQKGKMAFNGKLSAGYSNLRSCGLKATDYTGVETGVILYGYQQKINGIEGAMSDLYARIHLRDNIMQHTSITAGFITGTHTNSSAYCQISVIPLCIEIQNGFFVFYFNRAVLSADYKCSYVIKDMLLKHTFSAYTYLTLSPRIGTITGSKADFGVKVSYTVGDKGVTVSPVVAFEV